MAAFFKIPASPGSAPPLGHRPVLKCDWRLGADGRPVGRWQVVAG